MENEIKVGELVRTRNKGIQKIAYLRPNATVNKYAYFIEYDDDGDRLNGILKTTDIVKHSKNIIDLIEDEDIVILEYKTPKYRERIERKFIVCKIDDFINFENRNCNFTYKVGDKKIVDKICKNIKIKGILTTEQFNNEYYRLEE